VNSRIAAPKLALAVPSHVVERFLASSETSGITLGIGGAEVELPLAVRERHGLQHATAVMVVHLVEGELAERTGLLLGDILLSVDSEPTSSLGALITRLRNQSERNDLHLRILRGDQVQEIVAHPSDAPKEEAA
jgi:S1-C subfamily serine protease